jgi:hypothetical protein
MFLCIPREQIQRFKKALAGRDIKIEDLVRMSTEERTEVFRQFAGDQAKTVNTLFEEKLVLKNRIQGIKNWISKVGEVGRYDPAKKAKLDRLLSEYKAKQQERMFSPSEHEAFLRDLVEEKFGTRITREEAKAVFDLTAKKEGLKSKFNEKTGEWTSEKDRLSYGAADVVMRNYVSDLKDGKLNVRDMIRERMYEFTQEFKGNKLMAVVDLLSDVARTVSDNSISLVATLDNSFLGRQGLHTLQTHPTVWWKGALNSFKDMWKELRGKPAMDALLADIYSRENYLNGRYDKAGIIPKTEEQYPTSLPERIPVLGRVFKASESAFVGSGLRMRTGL